jgi:hypothetical protein
MNLAKREILKEWLREDASRYGQNNYRRVTTCGTVCCMAGHILERAHGECPTFGLSRSYWDDQLLITTIGFYSLTASFKFFEVTDVNVMRNMYYSIFADAKTWPRILERLYREFEDNDFARVEVACLALDCLTDEGCMREPTDIEVVDFYERIHQHEHGSEVSQEVEEHELVKV